MSRKYAVFTVAFNEEEYITACINNWKGVVDKHLVLVSTKPWNGDCATDTTFFKSRNAGAETIAGAWKTEAEQRTWGLARLYDYDYVIIVDADELYTKEDQKKIINRLDNPIDISYRSDIGIPAFRCKTFTTYWKNPDYILDPKDRHKPIIAVDPKQLYCHEHRQFMYINNSTGSLEYAPEIDINCHHMSWAKPDHKVAEKINSFSHCDDIRPNWFDEVWMKWSPGDETLIRPYGQEQYRAVYSPAPEEIKDLIERSK